MPKDYFGERIWKNYDQSAADMFEPAKVDPVVDFLPTWPSTNPQMPDEEGMAGCHQWDPPPRRGPARSWVRRANLPVA